MRKQMKVNVGNSRLNVRSGPSISYKIVGKLYTGDTVIVDSVKTLSNGQVWYRIEGTTTWIAQNDPVKGETGYLKLVKDLEQKPVSKPVKDEPVKTNPSPTPEPSPLPNQGTTPEWKNILNKYMTDPTIRNEEDPDKTKMPSKMTTGKGPQVSTHEPVYISKSNSYTDDELNADMIKIRKNLNIGNPERKGYTDSVVSQMFTQFNRFNIAFPDYHLNRTHVKIFFTRPDLNLLLDGISLNSQARLDQLYRYIYSNEPKIITYLTKSGATLHQFNPLISNTPKSFEVSDEYIKTVEAGETFTGHRIFYGRNDVESKAAGEISINYIDDYNLDIFKMHKIWVDYISKVFRGEFSPKSEYKLTKVLDYAVALYYFVMGPDGESILFWSKYTGVFPTNTSSSAFSWDKETTLKMPEINIKYVYSFKNDMDPAHLAEFNTLSTSNSTQYLTIYEEENVATGSTWAGAPFVISSKNSKGNTVYRLKWRPVNAR